MNKERKWKAFLVLEGLTQYYFAFGMLSQDNWGKYSIAFLVFYFGANVVEGIWGKEKTKKNTDLLDEVKDGQSKNNAGQ